MAGKRYEIKLSEADKTYEGFDGVSAKRKTFITAEEEVALLGMFMTLAANNLERKALVRCLDTIDRIENINHSDGSIIFDEEELEWAQNGIDATKGKRNGAYVKCRALIRQIVAPTEIEET